MTRPDAANVFEEMTVAQDAFPFFIGAARSGTTLLRTMVDAHPDIAIPPESWFITELASRRGDYETGADFDVERFAADLLAHDRFVRWGFEAGDLTAALYEAAPREYPSAIRSVFSCWAARQGKSRYGDKTPGYATELALLAALFPEACIVHLVRDGRDVALSYSETFGTSQVNAIRVWRSRVRAAREAGRALGVDRYREVRYEDLLVDPNSTLRDVCSFIGIPFSDRMLCHSEHAARLLAGMPDRQHHLHVALPLTLGLRDWRSQMSPHVVRACDSIAGDTLHELGYEPGPAGLTVRAQALVAKLYLERGAQLVRTTVREQAETRRRRSSGSSTPKQSDPPWPDPLQRSLLRVAFLEHDQAVEEWRSLRAHLVLDDIWDVETHRLLPLVYRRLVQLGVEDPELARLKGLHRRAWYENQLNLSRLAPLLTRLREAGIPAMVIKGVPLALRFYGDLGSRPMNDVDVLVRTDRMADTLRLLDRDGWLPYRDTQGRSEPLTSGFSLISEHSRIVTAPDGFYVDLHWHLREQFVVPGREMTSSDAFWSASEPIDILGVATRTLCGSDLLLHAIVHGLVSQHDARARWVADSLAVIRHPAAVDWERIIQQSRQRRLVLILRTALGYLVDHFQAEVPVDVLARLDRVPTTPDDERAYQRALRRDEYGPRLQGLFDLGPVWAWRRAHLGAVRALFDIPMFLRDTWQVPHTRDLPIEAARHLAERLRLARNRG